MIVIRIGRGRSKSGEILDRNTTWFNIKTIEDWERCVTEWSLKKIVANLFSCLVMVVPIRRLAVQNCYNLKISYNMEQWKTLWWNTRYEVSNLGRVRNRKSGKILATNPTKSHKKPQVWLYTDYFNSTLQYTLDKLVYFTFNGVSSRSEVKRVKHRDGNVMNCKLDNLYI